MTELWTDKWTRKVGEKPCFNGEWAIMLSRLSDDQIACGLMIEKISNKGWPSEIPEFYNNCVNMPNEILEEITTTCLYWDSATHLESLGLSKTKEAYYVICNCNYPALKATSFEQAKKIVEKALKAMIRAINSGYVLPDLPDPNIKQVGYKKVKTSFSDALNAMKGPIADENYTLQDLRNLRSAEVPA